MFNLYLALARIFTFIGGLFSTIGEKLVDVGIGFALRLSGTPTTDLAKAPATTLTMADGSKPTVYFVDDLSRDTFIKWWEEIQEVLKETVDALEKQQKSPKTLADVESFKKMMEDAKLKGKDDAIDTVKYLHGELNERSAEVAVLKARIEKLEQEIEYLFLNYVSPGPDPVKASRHLVKPVSGPAPFPSDKERLALPFPSDEERFAQMKIKPPELLVDAAPPAKTVVETHIPRQPKSKKKSK
jgi:hypothetical protein